MTPRRLILGLIGITLVVSFAAAAALLARPSGPFETTGEQAAFLHSQRLLFEGRQQTLVRHVFQSRGGRAQITWFDTDVEPATPKSRFALKIVVNGRPPSRSSSMDGLLPPC
jgi:hypothetical protein